jgi:peptidyl-prolyl cis-trans isomerase SurA
MTAAKFTRPLTGRQLCSRIYPASAALCAFLAAVASAGLANTAGAQTTGWAPSVTEGGVPVAPPAERRTLTARAAPPDGASGSVQSILVLVNDEPITGYEVEQRVALAMLGASDVQKKLQARLKSPNINDQFKNFAMKRLQANPPKSEAEQQARIRQLQGEFVASLKAQVEKDYKPEARKDALEELIDERLKLQEAKKLSVVATDEDVERIVAGMAERNSMTTKQFDEHLKKMGADLAVMRTRVRASLSWTDVIRRKFGHQITVVSRDLERVVASTEGQDGVELRVSRILLSMPAGASQSTVAHRMSEAETMRGRFGNCQNMEELVRGVAGARYDNLGDRRPTSIPEPTRSLLLNAHENELLPPTFGDSGVELWAVCGRKVIKAADQKRETAENELRQKEFEIISKKHLKDLRQDAHIEYR